ncbi:hypothetical protein GP486_004429 [Trichoglossum hirsutum]|uniref:Uncharacterized protein n=1 Tax=Trichoglossum hirsutum TaxID=265104 RepID=A0A9P8LAV2_9PEZI|nr:hypothetical protein GP486_004429 [Trichoglossum hirsutum]
MELRYDTTSLTFHASLRRCDLQIRKLNASRSDDCSSTVASSIEQEALIRSTLEEHTEVWRQLKKDSHLCGYVEDKVRYDFDPDIQELIVRTTTATHDLFIADVVGDICTQLTAIADSQGSAAEVAKQVKWQNTTRIILRDESGRADNSNWDAEINLEYPRRCPDAAFRHSAVKYPSVVLEVSFSQKRKDLPYLADSYIIGSGGSIGVVVALDLEHYRKGANRPQSKEATISVWRRKTWRDDTGTRHLGAEEVISQVPFRTPEGNPAPGNLSLKLEDFALPEVFDDISPSARTTPITISFFTLSTYLAQSQSAHDFIESSAGAKLLKTKQDRETTVAHKRKRSPVEEFDSADGVEIEEKEMRRARRAEEDDGLWEGQRARSTEEEGGGKEYWLRAGRKAEERSTS